MSSVSRLPSFLEMLQNPQVLLTFGNVQNPLCLPPKTTSESERQKVLRTRQFSNPPCIALYEVDILRAYKVGFRSPLYTPTMGDKAVFCARNMPLDLEDDFIQRWLSSLYPSGFPQGNDSIYAAMYFTDRWFPSKNGHNMSHHPL